MRDRARFQRGRSSCVPARVRPWKSKFSSTKSEVSSEARESMAEAASHSLRVDRSVDAHREAAPRR